MLSCAGQLHLQFPDVLVIILVYDNNAHWMFFIVQFCPLYIGFYISTKAPAAACPQVHIEDMHVQWDIRVLSWLNRNFIEGTLYLKFHRILCCCHILSLQPVEGQWCASSDGSDVNTSMLGRSTSPLFQGKKKDAVGLSSLLMSDVEQQPSCSCDPTTACSDSRGIQKVNCMWFWC